MGHKVFVSFLIWGFEDNGHDDLEKLLGIKPIKVHKKGQARSSRISALAKDNIFWIGFGLDEFQPFEDQMQALIGILRPRYSILKSVAQKYHTELSCAAYLQYGSDGSLPSIHLNKNDIEFLSDLGVDDFDIDLYLLPIKEVKYSSSIFL
jgi:Domain of unknown function (DUF4279)